MGPKTLRSAVKLHSTYAVIQSMQLLLATISYRLGFEGRGHLAGADPVSLLRLLAVSREIKLPIKTVRLQQATPIMSQNCEITSVTL